jgi:hypothetical protein
MSESKQNYTIDIERLRRDKGDEVANEVVRRLFARASDPDPGVELVKVETADVN